MRRQGRRPGEPGRHQSRLRQARDRAGRDDGRLLLRRRRDRRRQSDRRRHLERSHLLPGRGARPRHHEHLHHLPGRAPEGPAQARSQARVHGEGERRAEQGYGPRVQGHRQGQALLRDPAPGRRPRAAQAEGREAPRGPQARRLLRLLRHSPARGQRSRGSGRSERAREPDRGPRSHGGEVRRSAQVLRLPDPDDEQEELAAAGRQRRAQRQAGGSGCPGHPLPPVPLQSRRLPAGGRVAGGPDAGRTGAAPPAAGSHGPGRTQGRSAAEDAHRPPVAGRTGPAPPAAGRHGSGRPQGRSAAEDAHRPADGGLAP